MGKIVSIPVEGEFREGEHSVVWNGTENPTGVYFYRMIADDYDKVKRMVLIR